jgi:TPR repeat protein
MKAPARDPAAVALIWLLALGLGIPILAWTCLRIYLSLASARSAVSSDAKYEPMRSNDTHASLLVRSVATCLGEYKAAHVAEGYPRSLSDLGPSGTGCLTRDVVEGRLPGHQFEYVPSVGIGGRIFAYALCALPSTLGKTGWDTIVQRSQDPSAPPDIYGNMHSFRTEIATGATEPLGCAGTWETSGEALAHMAIQHCLFSYAAKHPDQGYPSEVALISSPGSVCLSLFQTTVSITGDVLTFDSRSRSQPRRYAYLPGLPEGDGRIATYLVVQLGSYKTWSNERGEIHSPVLAADSPRASIEERAKSRSARSNSTSGRLERECTEGSAESCARWGDSLVPEFSPNYRFGTEGWTRALAAYGQGCDRKDGLSCYRLGEAYAAGRFSEGGKVRESLSPDGRACAYFERSCRLGVAEGCWDLIGSREATPPLCAETDSLPTKSALERACRANHLKACVALGRSLVKQGNRFTAKDAERSAQYFENACTPAEASGCASLAIAYAEGRGKPRDKARARYFLRFACAVAGDNESCLARSGG